MKTITKIILGLLLLSLIIGTVSAEIVDDFKAPTPLNPLGTSSFADGNGHNIQLTKYTQDSHRIWFENDTGTNYYVEPYSQSTNFYIYVDGAESDTTQYEAIGILEIIEHNGEKYIVSSWTAKDSDSDIQLAYNNLLQFNELNHLTPLAIE